MQVQSLKKNNLISVISISAVLLLAVGAGTYFASQAKPSRNQDTQEAERVMKEYLKLRESEEVYKRYRFLSKRVKGVLKQSGITSEEEFRDHISDEATFVGSQIITTEKLDKDRVKFTVKCKVLTEHPGGGITTESLREFFLVWEDSTWRVDDMLVEGERYRP